MSLEAKGRKKMVTIAATAGNVDTEISAGTGKRIKPLYGSIVLVADATVQNRYLDLYIEDPDDHLIGPIFRGPTPAAASETKYYGLYDRDLGDIADNKGFTLTGTDNVILLPSIIDGLDHITLVIQGGVAGDSYSGYLVVLEL